MEETRELVNLIVRALEDKKGGNIRVIDIREVSVMADYFIIADGTNTNQVQALSDNVAEAMAKAGKPDYKIEGYQSAGWILMDYGDMIVNILTADMRERYNIEKVWADCDKIEY